MPGFAGLLDAALIGKVSCDSDSNSHEAETTLARRLGIAKALYASWTKNGADEAALAERYLDGSLCALDSFVSQQKEDIASSADYEAERTIDRRSADDLSVHEFVVAYMLPNKPVLIQGTNRGWAAAQDWIMQGTIDLDFLARSFGNSQIDATEIDRHSQAYGAGKRHKMSLREYLDYWAQHKAGADERILYLKDWHFVAEHPSYQAYACPEYFEDDWLNDYHDLCQSSKGAAQEPKSQQDIATSDYRFVYLGPKGSWTPIHADVLCSFSWSTNLCGRKIWRLLPPEHTPLLLDRFGRELAARFDVSDPDAAGRFPNLALAASRTLDIEQGVDEALFVPSGWHHYVENLEDTLSINHNWVNGFNVLWSWRHLKQEHSGAMQAIEDCRSTTTAAEFEDLVQRNMAANCGVNYTSLARFLGTIAVRQIARLADAADPDRLRDAFSLHRCLLVLRELEGALGGGLPGCLDAEHTVAAAGDDRACKAKNSADTLTSELDGLTGCEDREQWRAFLSRLIPTAECSLDTFLGRNRA